MMRTRQTRWQTLALITLCVWTSAAASLSAQSPAPGVEHKKLEIFVGEWRFAGESKAVPALGMTDAGKVSYRHVNQMANGGFFLETRRTGTSARGSVTELFVYSYNAVSKTIGRTATTIADRCGRSRPRSMG